MLKAESVFLAAAAGSRGLSAASLERYFERLFPAEIETGGRALDIGGGDGLFSFALSEAGFNVVCVEPLSEGSGAKMLSNREKLSFLCRDSRRVEFRDALFQEVNLDGPFDIILMHNSVNHLDEGACSRLLHDSQAQESYVQIFSKCKSLMKRDGTIIVSDCGRRNFFGDFRLPNPFAPDINWHVHQQPLQWVKVLQLAGFSDPEVRWNFSTRAPKIISNWLSNGLGAYFTSSHFTIRAGIPE